MKPSDHQCCKEERERLWKEVDLFLAKLPWGLLIAHGHRVKDEDTKRLEEAFGK